ncbi:MAG: NTP transferase domain-containing protein [Dehalococcoidales bacterium]|nr:NTP transferase domain-containing protein [Dehalococcoidales bacterium]
MHRLLAVILAGGTGERLSILSQERAKPAVPFAGKYRIIDFSLSNCVNSGVYNVIVLTQYQPVSITEHIGIGAPWGLVPPDRNIRLLQPYLAREEGRDWYKGTADAVHQNLDRIEAEDIDEVLILSGDHVYKTDYSAMLEFHRGNDADVTLAVTRMPEEELYRFGTVVTDEKGQITRFQEKVKNPQSNLVNMGVYMFNIDTLRHWLEIRTGHDFGRNIFPKMVNKGRMFAYNFDGYWRDIGTVESLWQSNMEVLAMSQSFLSDIDWPLYTREAEIPPTKVGDNATVTNCLLSGGCKIEGHIERSIISPGVQVAEGAIVKDSIIMDNTVIGRNSIIDRSILDKEIIIEADCHIGFGDDYRINRTNPKVLNTGLSIIGKRTVIPSSHKIGRNCIIYDNVVEGDFPEPEVKSGETIKPKRKPIRIKA